MIDYNELAELRKIQIAKKWNRAIFHEMTFAKLMRNERKFCVLFRKNFVKGNPKLNGFLFVYMYTKTGFCLFTSIPKLVSVCLHVYQNWFLFVYINT